MKRTQYLKNFKDYKESTNEQLHIYEFEDETKPEADLDSETATAEEEVDTKEVPAETPTTEAPVEETPAETPEAPIDFGDDNTSSISPEELNAKTEFIDGIMTEYKKLIKNGGNIDSKIQDKIQAAFDALK